MFHGALMNVIPAKSSRSVASSREARKPRQNLGGSPKKVSKKALMARRFMDASSSMPNTWNEAWWGGVGGVGGFVSASSSSQT